MHCHFHNVWAALASGLHMGEASRIWKPGGGVTGGHAGACSHTSASHQFSCLLHTSFSWWISSVLNTRPLSNTTVSPEVPLSKLLALISICIPNTLIQYWIYSSSPTHPTTSAPPARYFTSTFQSTYPTWNSQSLQILTGFLSLIDVTSVEFLMPEIWDNLCSWLPLTCIWSTFSPWVYFLPIPRV